MKKDCELCAGLNKATTKVFYAGRWWNCCDKCQDQALEDYE